MKKLFTLACSIAILAMFCSASAQSQDTALARNDQKEDLKKSEGELKAMERSAYDLEKKKGTSPENVEPAAKFTMPLDQNSKRSILNNKVGPNGEELFLEDGKYYYTNGAGEKVKVETSGLKDKAKHS